MLFNSLGFVVFFIIVLGLYYAPLLNWRRKKWMLLIASYTFYGLWNPPLIFLLWISTLIDWTAGVQLMKESRQRYRKLWLLLSLIVNLGFLAFFKCGNFLLSNFKALLASVQLDYNAPEMDIILPMGISFYTFQTMSYTIDVYNRKTERAKTFLDFALYVTFFPQLVAGPIVRAQHLITQFYKERKADIEKILWGAFLLTVGLFQKVVMADTLLSAHVDKMYGHDGAVHIVDAWSGTLAFAGQIFFDFAGYSTCAIGIACMLGFYLPDNFKFPYAAIGFSDFWRRWHITLSTWLRDYLYIPLGGNKFGLTRMYAALMITMLLGGLWHGAAWTFVVWGALHGTYLIVERPFRAFMKQNQTGVNGLLLALFTFFLVNITWVFFRAQDFNTARNILQSMFGLHPEGSKVLHTLEIYKIFVISAGLFIAHYFMRNTNMKEVSAKMSPLVLGLIWGLLAFFIMISQGSGEQFIYFQF